MKLYHISQDVRRQRFRMIPRVPSSCMLEEDMVTPRICVAPSIAQCLRGRRGLNPTETCIVRYGHSSDRLNVMYHWGVYVAEAEPVEPVGVPDAEQTGELWLTKSTIFDKVGEICATEVDGTGPYRIRIKWEWVERDGVRT